MGTTLDVQQVHSPHLSANVEVELVAIEYGKGPDGHGGVAVSMRMTPNSAIGPVTRTVVFAHSPLPGPTSSFVCQDCGATTTDWRDTPHVNVRRHAMWHFTRSI